MAEESRKAQLIADLARARHELTASVSGLRRDLDVVHRLETAFQRHRLAWLTGTSLLGFLLARFAARRKKVVVQLKGRKPAVQEHVVKAGILVTALKIAFDLARPALTKWLTHRVTTYAAQRFGGSRH